MENHPTRRTGVRTIGLTALAALVALVAAVSSSSADGTPSRAAPPAVTQSFDGVPVQDTTPRETPPADSERPDRDCPKDGSGDRDGGAGGSTAPGTTSPAPAL